jgi:hypothetical protein
VCEEACHHVDVDCQFMQACALAGSLLGVDLVACDTRDAECIAGCLVDADCAALGSLITQTPDPDLMACIGTCQPCFTCAATMCMVEIQACQNDAACQAFTMCVQSCPMGDPQCFQDCGTNNPSQATSDLAACVGLNCSAECGLSGGGGAGGTGGGGGAGGAGGAGGN